MGFAQNLVHQIVQYSQALFCPARFDLQPDRCIISITMKRTLLALISSVIIGTCILYGASSKPRFVEVWCVGDDGLTQHLRDAVESKFKSSSDFILSSGKKSGTLIVTIPTNVEWTQNGTQTRVRYKVVFSSTDEAKVGKDGGSCWDDNISACAAQIYMGAQRASHKLH